MAWHLPGVLSEEFQRDCAGNLEFLFPDYAPDPNSSELFTTFSDADHGGCKDTGRSTGAYTVKIGTGKTANFQLFLTIINLASNHHHITIIPMATQPLNIQQQVYAGYWRKASGRRTVTDLGRRVQQRKNQPELPNAPPQHHHQIEARSQHGTLQGIDTVGILPDNPQAKESKVYIKGYTVANNAITGNLPISDNRWWEPFYQHYAAVAMENTDQERMVREKEAHKATATLQAAADEILQKKMAKQGEKQVEKRRQGAEAEESEPVKEDAGEERGRQATRGVSSSTGPSRARTASRASKRLKRTPSEEDGQHQTDEEEGNNPNLLDAFYHPTKAKQTPPSPADMDEDMPSGEEPGALQDPSATQPKGHKVTKAKGKGKARQPLPNAMDEDSSSEESEPPLSEVFIPWVDKGEGREIPPASSIPGPSAAEVNIVEHRTTTLVDQLTKQLADMWSWETASKEMDQMADAEDLEWDRRLANMDELLRESHARHRKAPKPG
ncbi:hypothetical protein PAXRUDRAFT_20723 [Paxillus rubicundulus Ve08.2h10]|uniref:Uncharacterized protein n=1 Tax=Paxillus rubicundulus Ve08.2h10 TaxID=930991 RepID=A0A0D0CDD0_9AGAM|nr:hypothetical protein PAXRUDRAFT_20723 [Paxillus rubicundulus Ve08.2h10]